MHDIDLKFMIEYIYSVYRVVTRLEWCIWESYSLSCVYGDTLWDTQHTHIIADKLCGSWIYIKSCIFSTIMIWIFLYCYHDSDFYIDISVYRYIVHITITYILGCYSTQPASHYVVSKLGHNPFVNYNWNGPVRSLNFQYST